METVKHEFTRWMITKFLTRDVFVSLLTLIIVTVTVIMLFRGTDKLPEFWQTCFALVIGYYFRGPATKE